jgi:hypothetical protein
VIFILSQKNSSLSQLPFLRLLLDEYIGFKIERPKNDFIKICCVLLLDYLLYAGNGIREQYPLK